MVQHHTQDILVGRRRNLVQTALVFIAAVLMLPTPPGPFNLTLRNYFPKEAAYDGSYKVPPVKKMP